MGQIKLWPAGRPAVNSTSTAKTWILVDVKEAYYNIVFVVLKCLYLHTVKRFKQTPALHNTSNTLTEISNNPLRIGLSLS